MKVLFFIFLTTILFLPSSSFALEVYTLIKNGCEPQTGLIISTDDNVVNMLDLNGTMTAVQRKDVELVLVYHIHNNPIKTLDLNSKINQYLKKIEVDDNEHTRFYGWPIKFIENIIVFYDIEGKTHLVDIDKIKTIKEPTDLEFGFKNILNHKQTNFGFGDNLPECQYKSNDSKKYIEPTRMISDKIKIHKFFSVYQNGFSLLKRFQKKTIFYAKPFLYDKESRFGLIMYPVSKYQGQELNFLMGLYFKWSSGKPYGSQGEYVIGGQPVELLPSVEPHSVLRADGKSHFFSGSFVGNLFCLAGGSDCLIENRAFFTDFSSQKSDSDHTIYPQFNYLALTGIDYKEYSFSGGFYYPIYGIWGNNIFREVTSDSSSPILKIQKTTKDQELKLIYSSSKISSSSPKTSENIKLIQTSELKEHAILSNTSSQLINNLNSFALDTKYVRIGFDYDISHEASITLDEVVFWGGYKEQFSGNGYELDFTHYTTSLKVRQDFSNYISVIGQINHFLEKNSYKSVIGSGTSDENKVSFSVSIEFVQ